MSNKIIADYYNPGYPAQPPYHPGCGVNEIYKTIPPTPPYAPGEGTEFETTAVGPSSIKHLYSGIPNFYPYRRITRPVNSLYGHDYSQYHSHGAQGKGKRISYHYKVYPLTNRHAREVQEYSDELLPYMDMSEWTKHPVRRDASVNSPLQDYPQAYIPDMY